MLVSGGRDNMVKLWNALTGSLLHCFDGHANWVRDVIIHPTGNYIISCSDDKTIRVFDVANKRCLRVLEQLHKGFISSLAMHSKFPVLVSGSSDSSINVIGLR